MKVENLKKEFVNLARKKGLKESDSLSHHAVVFTLADIEKVILKANKKKMVKI